MAHFAKIEDGIVMQVVVINNADITDEKGVEHPELAAGLLGDGFWVQTSYNGSFRGCYAGIGYAYDPELDQFIPPPLPPAESLTEQPPEG